MSNYNNNDTLSKNNNNNNGCLNQYYRYVVGMTPPNQSPVVDINQYQKLYVDTLVGKCSILLYDPILCLLRQH